MNTTGRLLTRVMEHENDPVLGHMDVWLGISAPRSKQSLGRGGKGKARERGDDDRKRVSTALDPF